jgi:hypothetical protein
MVPREEKGERFGEEAYDRRARVAGREEEKGKGYGVGGLLLGWPSRVGPGCPFSFFFSPSFFSIFLISVLFV